MHYNNLKSSQQFPIQSPISQQHYIGDRIVSANFSNDVSDDNNKHDGCWNLPPKLLQCDGKVQTKIFYFYSIYPSHQQ